MNEIINGDALSVLKNMQSESVNVCVTSPPYYGLRDYGAAGQIGLEQTPEEYIEKLVEVFREVRRVLRPDGTLWLNIGDSYATTSGGQPPTNTRNSCGHTAKKVPTGYKKKDLIGIPWMLAFALRADGWYLRQDIIWQKPNCMPESVKDRCTKSHEYIFLLSKSPKYYFDAEAISEPIAESTVKRCMNGDLPRFGGSKYGDNPAAEARTKSGKEYEPKARKNKRDVWSVSTNGFKGAHFAVFPEELVRPCILAGAPAGGVALDPFFGSGTVGAVAIQEGRNFIGIELNPEYVSIAQNRVWGDDKKIVRLVRPTKKEKEEMQAAPLEGQISMEV